MKKVFLLISLLAVSFWVYASQDEKRVTTKQTPATTVVPSQKSEQLPVVKTSKSIFVTYWGEAEKEKLEEYDKVIYFGISANTKGINREDVGYTRLQSFLKNVNNNQKKYLTLRMLDTNTNIDILESKSAQQKIIEETITLLQEHDFDGIVVDLEMSVLAFSDVKEQITTFHKDFYTAVKEEDLEYIVTMYGDVFSRGRPFDVKTIAEHSDEMMIMAYDFSKSYGEPGPNFPLEGKEEYGYDFKSMISDFTARVQAEKLTVIFGMYGYSWPLGPQGKPLKQATAVPLNNIKTNFLQTCIFTECMTTRDPISAETKITYKDNDGNNRVLWFEDEQSVEKKIEFLKEKGIGGLSYWVYGYF